MNKRAIFVFVSATAILCACNSNKAKISGRFVGNDSEVVYLQQITPLEHKLIDSTVLSHDGAYRFTLKDMTRTPMLYNLIYNGEIIPLLVEGGDRLIVGSVGSVVRNYTVEGSKESELLRNFYKSYVDGVRRLDSIVMAYSLAGISELERQARAKEYTAEYYRIRREQLRFIIEHKGQLASIYALNQRLPGDTNLFNGDSDVIYYRTVAEALEKSYPESPYLAALNAEITRMDARMALASQVAERGYPDLELVDMYGKKIRLSSLQGKVILVDFWSAALGSSNALNADMKELYGKYADSATGFEIYQVSLDTSKAEWIDAVQDQQLPWISVVDLRGKASSAVGLYNIQKLPTNFLIDREGTIVARDLYDKNLERKLDELTR